MVVLIKTARFGNQFVDYSHPTLKRTVSYRSYHFADKLVQALRRRNESILEVSQSGGKRDCSSNE
jgi:hypothetical protein